MGLTDAQDALQLWDMKVRTKESAWALLGSVITGSHWIRIHDSGDAAK